AVGCRHAGCLLLKQTELQRVIVDDKNVYGFFGLALIVALYIARKSCWAQVAVIMLWCIAEYYFKLHSLVYALYAMLAIFPVLMYKGERGRKMGIGFYLVYPVHLCIFSLIGFALSR
ncbi:MAG: hypothetical protein J6J62_09925, partial [Oscillospiraceae bacterium]|nr:hypothetical protein [Oscillospiraceae bacterium]